MSNIPKGYKQTEVGVIPEYWGVKPLNQLVGFTNGKAHENSIKDDGKYIVVNSKFISSEGEVIKFSDDCFCPTEAENILMVMSDVPNGKAIAKCFFVDKNNCYTVNQRICSLKVKVDDPKLLFYLINRNRYYLTFDDGVKQTNLRKDDVLGCPIPLPPTKAEQTAIATALSDADALIISLEKLIFKKRNIKQGATQELLTGKKRLPGFSGEWEVKKLGEIADIFKGSGLSKSKLNPSGIYKCILYGELFTTYSQVIKNVISRTNANEGVLSKKGDILMPGSTTTIGIDLAIASALLEAGILLGGDINIIRKKVDSYDSEFIAHYLTQVKKHEIAELSQGITIIHLYGRDLNALSITIPAKREEQTAIAQILSDMDAEIEHLEQKLDKYRMMKQGMMQELLTGKTRLV